MVVEREHDIVVIICLFSITMLTGWLARKISLRNFGGE